jgi:hypothetical protein
MDSYNRYKQLKTSYWHARAGSLRIKRRLRFSKKEKPSLMIVKGIYKGTIPVTVVGESHNICDSKKWLSETFASLRSGSLHNRKPWILIEDDQANIEDIQRIREEDDPMDETLLLNYLVSKTTPTRAFQELLGSKIRLGSETIIPYDIRDNELTDCIAEFGLGVFGEDMITQHPNRNEIRPWATIREFDAWLMKIRQAWESQLVVAMKNNISLPSTLDTILWKLSSEMNKVGFLNVQTLDDVPSFLQLVNEWGRVADKGMLKAFNDAIHNGATDIILCMGVNHVDNSVAILSDNMCSFTNASVPDAGHG